MIKHIFLSSLVLVFLCACTNKVVVTKERDARNAFVEPSLVIPPNMSHLDITPEPELDNSYYVEAIVFQLLFNEHFNSYQKSNTPLPFTLNDINFVRMFNKGNDFSNIREELNREYLRITTTNKRFLNKIFNWQVVESLNTSNNEYINLNNTN